MANKFTLCWDCKKATGDCRWSSSLRPVDGWDAIKLNLTSSKPYSTYFVKSCPQFERDSYDGGSKKSERKSTYE